MKTDQKELYPGMIVRHKLDGRRLLILEVHPAHHTWVNDWEASAKCRFVSMRLVSDGDVSFKRAEYREEFFDLTELEW